MRTAAKLAVLVLLSGWVVRPAYSHHSFAMFDEKQCLSIAGTVKKFQWAYPHIWLWVLTQDAAHAETVWGFEGGDPGTLAVAGWNAETLSKGDKITVFFNPLIDGRKGGSMRQVTLPTGKTLGTQVAGSADGKYFKACAPSK